MPWRHDCTVQARCYPSGKSAAFRIAGFILIGLGLLLIIVCVPCWVWLAALGAVLVFLGLLLIRK